MLTLITLALNYSISMIVAPQYATFGPQTFCDRFTVLGVSLDCKNHKELVKPCSELADNPAAKAVCTPSVGSTFLNRVTMNFPFFGVVIFWAQFVFLGKHRDLSFIEEIFVDRILIVLPHLGIYLIVFLTSLLRTPKLDERQNDEDAEEAEEESLLGTTGRRFNAAWQDVTGRASRP
jgi:LMBR1 domain-containing protein 1